MAERPSPVVARQLISSQAMNVLVDATNEVLSRFTHAGDLAVGVGRFLTRRLPAPSGSGYFGLLSLNRQLRWGRVERRIPRQAAAPAAPEDGDLWIRTGS